jgi:hypothetical protein
MPPDHGEGDVLAQVVWQLICWVGQPIWHDALAVALLVVVAALVGAEPGTIQLAWQVAACALQAIMQFVTAEVCARRIFPPADASLTKPATAATATRTAKHRMTAPTGLQSRFPL